MTLTDEQLQNRVKWVRALRSGDYSQGRHTLKRGTSEHYEYCCLGVACEVVIPGAVSLVMDGNTSVSSLMNNVELKQFGMSDDDQRVAASWNDSRNYSFSFIADLVAYATANEKSFRFTTGQHIPDDYSIGWLSQFD